MDDVSFALLEMTDGRLGFVGYRRDSGKNFNLALMLFPQRLYDSRQQKSSACKDKRCS